MNLADPELELVDPTPNVHMLFVQFDKIFFWAELKSRAVVRWSKRMYSCAGICSYDRGGLCDIALSEPLLKLRPRKDLVETLLHEMIHAYLFIKDRDRERDGHGPIFKAHMHRINKAAGLNISIYHDFHEEVKLYQSHWWRCDGPCQTRKPYFGIVRRSQNRAPGPQDYWWSKHRMTCGGTFVKFKEPENKKSVKKNVAPEINNVITKYINNNNDTIDKNIRTIDHPPKDDRKPFTQIQKKTGVWSGSIANTNNSKPVLINGVLSSPNKKPDAIPFYGNGQTIDVGRNRSNSVGVAETVRDIWAKRFGNTNTLGIGIQMINHNVNRTVGSKSIRTSINSDSPPMKIQKIDDFFKNTTKSVLKDIYGQDFEITKSKSDDKLKVVPVKSDLVDCPICGIKVDNNEINRHLDECLNKDIIKELSQSNSQDNVAMLEKIISASPVSAFNVKTENTKVVKEANNILSSSNVIDLTNINFGNASVVKKEPKIKDEKGSLTFDPVDVDKVKSIVKKIQFDKHVRKSGDFIVPKEEPKEVVVGFLPSFLDDRATEIKIPPVKVEPGSSKDGAFKEQNCPCCGNKVDKPMAEHLDECLAFFDNNTTIPEEGASTSFANNTIDLDSDGDFLDETLTMNATGTKTPCPCCMKMIETDDMNRHLDDCLS